MKPAHKQALDALRASLVARLHEHHRYARWCRVGRVLPCAARHTTSARDLIAQLRALDAVRDAANGAEGFPAAETTREGGALHTRVFMVRPW